MSDAGSQAAVALPRYRGARVGGCLQAEVKRAADGSTRLRSTEALGPYPVRVTDHLARWAREAPERAFVARRGADGAWVQVSYAQMLARAEAVGQALLELGVSAERPLAILSGNDIEHLTLALAAAWVGVPHVPVSPPYSLLDPACTKLRQIWDQARPAALYAATPAFAAAVAAVAAPDVPVIAGPGADGAFIGREVWPFARLLATRPGPQAGRAHAAVGAGTPWKLLFTSGSTGTPKGVINTHGMLCSNWQMQAQAMAFVEDEPPVLVDWLPWSHTFGGNQNVGIALRNGGTLYIDDGKPTPAGMVQTLANLREIAPTLYLNVPKGFEELSLAMEADTALRERLFSRVKAFMFAGAGLSQAVWDRLDRLAEATVGERIRIVTGLGMTETSPSCLFVVQPGAGAGHVGLPAPGVEVKLVPDAADSGKTEIRFRGPHVMPGYWRAPELSAKVFDDEGFYCSGDAVRWVDPADPQRGLMFDGRIAEDFKLSSGTFVSVGPLRARVIAAGDPLVQDVVVAGINRDQIGLLVFPRVEDIRRHFALPGELPAEGVLTQPPVRGHFQALLDRLHAEGTGSATRPARLLLLTEPPRLDRGELTDKNSLNQRAVLQHRAAWVEALYDDTHPDTLRACGR